MKNHELANLLRDIRHKTELSQSNFAKLVDLGPQTILRLETGFSCKFSTLRKIAKVTHVDPETWTQLIIAWIRLELNEDVQWVDIKPSKHKPTKNDLISTISAHLTQLTLDDQRMFLFFMQNPKTLKLLPYIQQLHTEISEPPHPKPKF